MKSSEISARRGLKLACDRWGRGGGDIGLPGCHRPGQSSHLLNQAEDAPEASNSLFAKLGFFSLIPKILQYFLRYSHKILATSLGENMPLIVRALLALF